MKKLIMGVLCITATLCANDFASGLKNLDGAEDDKAYQTFFQLAKSGDAEAQTLLGEMYLDGIGTDMDVNKAFYWISKASNNGDVDAQYLLGFMYENGIKVAVNVPRAVTLYQKAAKQGDILSQYSLAMIYKEGKGGIKKDMIKAYKWLAKVQLSKKGLEYQARAD
jgi:TPR repeat protein